MRNSAQPKPPGASTHEAALTAPAPAQEAPDQRRPGTSSPGRASRTLEGAAPAEDPRGQLQVVNPSATSLQPPTRSRGPPAGARPGRGTAPAGHLSDCRKVVRASHSRGQRDPGGDPGNPIRQRPEAA
ncbi:hypothetical protein NDU88_002951 [Pleurodeles waltl]|uniref:Uncharacterized protein n=1 Tax=Pleurodeles waltl TaxID=8319 RepID=A0AAV7SG06_PLEWA|nr:hypothetical protein NDU88_002951 [Pleurodeles waltl]